MCPAERVRHHERRERNRKSGRNHRAMGKDNPVKTRQSEFLKQFPNARLKEGVLIIDPCKIDITSKEDDKCEALKPECIAVPIAEKYWFTEVD